MREITCCPARAEETLPGGAARCPVLTPCLSLRLQPGLVQPWQESELHCECYLCIYRLDLLTEGLTPPSFLLPSSFLPSFSSGGKKEGAGVGKFLGPAAAALGRSPGNGCEAAPPRGGRCCCCRHRSCNTNSGKQTTGCCRRSPYPAPEGGGGHISGAL